MFGVAPEKDSGDDSGYVPDDEQRVWNGESDCTLFGVSEKSELELVIDQGQTDEREEKDA
jgi:hypothetical protein